jgi:hypothetical protein
MSKVFEVGVPVVKPQFKPHQHWDPLGHHHDHQEWRRETIFPIVSFVGLGRPPLSIGLNDFLDIVLFWKTTQFYALAVE